MKKSDWPMLKTIHLKPAMEPEMAIDATVDMDGRALVTIHHFAPTIDDQMFHPHEAERLARALLKAAACARAKRKAARR